MPVPVILDTDIGHAGDGAMTSTELYMTRDEQSVALVRGGFAAPELLKAADELAMYRVTR